MSAARKGKGRAPVSIPQSDASLPLGKQLAHTDKAVRDQAIANLTAFLSRGGDIEDGGEASSSGYVRISDAEMAKLWKGLFYCFWMSDKPLVQQALASDLSSLLLRIKPRVPKGGDPDAARLDAALAFLEGFWVALVREWNGIDRLRMDKYYMLIRRFVNATFRLLARHAWNEEAIATVNGMLSAEHGPMTWRDPAVPNSLATHLADVFLDELDKVLGDDDGEMAAPLLPLLAPFLQLAARTRTPLVRDRMVNMVVHPLLRTLGGDGDEDEAQDAPPPAKRSRTAKGISAHETKTKHEIYANIAVGSCAGPAASEEPEEPTALRRALLKALFKEAAQESSVESNRRRLYQVVREAGDDDDSDDEE